MPVGNAAVTLSTRYWRVAQGDMGLQVRRLFQLSGVLPPDVCAVPAFVFGRSVFPACSTNFSTFVYMMDSLLGLECPFLRCEDVRVRVYYYTSVYEVLVQFLAHHACKKDEVTRCITYTLNTSAGS